MAMETMFLGFSFFFPVEGDGCSIRKRKHRTKPEVRCLFAFSPVDA
jgi:hypothetical protein